MSDPAEYAIPRITRDAGRAIFERTGLGDPYRTGLPYPIFLALLEGFPQVFGASTAELAARFGFIDRAPDPASDDLDAREGLPVGMHLTTDPITGVPFVVTSCALCHAERLRWPGGEALVVGLGNKRVRIHAYDRAFAEVTARSGFTAPRLLRLAGEAAARRKLAWPDRYADALVGATVAALRQRAADRAELHARTRGDPPGRVAVIEAFVPALRRLSKRPISFAPDAGWAKVPDVIGYRARTTLSWDGSQEGPIDLLVVEADLATGARIEWLERHPFQGPSLGAYLRQPAPRPAFPGPIDRGRAARGRALFVQHCADCHGTYADDGAVRDYTEAIIPIDELGTDPARLLAATESFERAANDPALTRGYTRFHRSAGYIPPVLTHVWARAPYGHAGQWPSLAVLATPPERRPTRFVVDLDAPYDLAAVGVATRAPGALPAAMTANAYMHDASLAGFSVGGHTFLAALDAADADAVIEFLKTL
jgi:mono/diheme cytochrome c family protein